MAQVGRAVQPAPIRLDEMRPFSNVTLIAALVVVLTGCATAPSAKISDQIARDAPESWRLTAIWQAKWDAEDVPASITGLSSGASFAKLSDGRVLKWSYVYSSDGLPREVKDLEISYTGVDDHAFRPTGDLGTLEQNACSAAQTFRVETSPRNSISVCREAGQEFVALLEGGNSEPIRLLDIGSIDAGSAVISVGYDLHDSRPRIFILSLNPEGKPIELRKYMLERRLQ